MALEIQYANGERHAFDNTSVGNTIKSWWPDAQGDLTDRGYPGAFLVDVPPPAQPFSQLKANKIAAINGKRDAVLAAGALFGGKRIKVDDAARADLAGMATTANTVLLTASSVAPVAWPASYAEGWIAIDNTRAPIATPMAGLALALECGIFYAAAVQNARTLKDEALTAISAEELDAIDIEAGWPE